MLVRLAASAGGDKTNVAKATGTTLFLYTQHRTAPVCSAALATQQPHYLDGGTMYGHWTDTPPHSHLPPSPHPQPLTAAPAAPTARHCPTANTNSHRSQTDCTPLQQSSNRLTNRSCTTQTYPSRLHPMPLTRGAPLPHTSLGFFTPPTCGPPCRPAACSPPSSCPPRSSWWTARCRCSPRSSSSWRAACPRRPTRRSF